MHPLTLSVLSLLFATPIPQAPLTAGTSASTSPRLSWADFDGDGLPDLAIARTDGLRVLRNLGAGRFEDVSSATGLDALSGARIALWGDFDGDGAVDLFVGSDQGAHLLLNDGRGSLRDATRAAGLDQGIGAVREAIRLDFDADGWPDLQLATERGDLLLRNVGGGVFEPVELGLGGEEPVVVVQPGAEEPVPPSRPGTQAVGAAPGGFSAVPSGTRAAATVAGICAGSIFDQALGACIPASMVPALGSLMPLSIDLNVDLAGNVGIGTTSPVAKLDVVGDVRSSGQLVSTAASGAPLSVASSDLVAGLNADLLDGVEASAFSQLGNEIEGSEIADGTITAADLAPGAVGSGGIAPAAVGPTELAADAVTSAKLAPGAVDTTKIADGTLLNGDVASNAAIAGTKVSPDFGSQTVRTTGQVGVGTTSPERALHVMAGSAGTVTSHSNSIAVFERSTSGYVSILTPDGNDKGILFGNPTSNVSGGIIYDGSSAGAESMQFRTGGNATRMTITQAGDVGIGTTAPLYDVHVRGDSPLGTLLVTPGVSDSQSEVRLAENQTASLGMIMRYNGANNDLEVRGYGTGGESTVHFFADRDSGVAGFPTATAKVGIGTASPLGKLHVVDAAGGDGSVRLPNNSIASAEIVNETGIAFDGGPALFSTVNSTVPKIVLSRSISCPTSGYLLAIATCSPRSNGSGQHHFSINKNSAAHNASNKQFVVIGSGDHQQVTVQGMFSVGAGTTVIRFLASNDSSGVPDMFAYFPRMSVIFVPSAYGAVDAD